ncbi:MAG: protein kinase, partial [bacterium]
MPDAACEYDTFISYAAPDRVMAMTLASALTARGMRVCVDFEALAPGDDWERALPEKIGAARCFVALLSSHWGEGHYNRQELGLARKHQRAGSDPRRIIAVELEPGDHSFEFETAVTIAAGNSGWIERLIASIEAEPAGPAQLTLVPDPRERDIEDAIVREPSSAPDLRAKLLEEKRAEKRRAVRGEPLDDTVCLGGRYRLVERLGRGGFAEVWRALDRDDDLLPVAVKVLHWNLGHDESARSRFRRGARHMRRMNHPHIVRVLGEPQEDGGHHYFVMELVEGTALDRFLTERDIPSAEVPALIRQIGDALAYAHAREIRHRDVHPGNIIVRPDGAVVLIDFDLVEAPGTLGGTRTGALGTAVFAAPESYMPSPDGQPKQLDAVRLDVFGLAMTAAACWLGRLPHPGDTRQFDRFIGGLDCTEAQKRALKKGLEVAPADRFASIDDLCAALQLPAPGMFERREPSGKEWRRGKENPLGALAAELPPAAMVHLRAPWDGDDLANALRSLDGRPLSRALDALSAWISPARSPEELAYVWYAAERVGRAPDRADFFARAGRPLQPVDLAWVDVPGGRFEMGTRRKHEGPAHPVEVAPCALTATPITAAQYAVFDPGHQP